MVNLFPSKIIEDHVCTIKSLHLPLNIGNAEFFI
jgi:hypothetical protein